MSESMAFIGGVAVAGLAALVLLKGTGTPNLQPNIAVAPQMPATVVAPQMMQPGQYPAYGQPYPNPAPINPSGTEEFRMQMERQKSQLDVVQRENDLLKQQIPQLQYQLENYKNQAQLSVNNQAAQQAALKQTETPWSSSPIVWAVAGMTLTIGGGVVVAGVLALFSPRQRATRTVQVIHPYNGSTPPLAPVRRAEFLPPRVETRRVEATEYDEMH
ncbi:heterocyst differentiation related protein [Tolypothrix sp. NIES-4075]|uniref:heterocyst differentiation related protein n=1 Tax=Tolypothrix sp. NIES-4075 TaxID=2005459 RepID=UPI000B5CF854|nr:heterocyst differentiation related protein [Tolypothrix sp. NIES-4075]GAX42225.1 heterocyst differentiation related protein [Tolypothrix sp. NIES-4075]